MATTLPWGFEFVRSAQVGGRVRPRGGAPDADLRGALLPERPSASFAGSITARDIARRRPGILFGIGLLGTFLTRFFIEFIKTEQEAFEVGWAAGHGAVAEHSVHRAGYLHDLAGRVPSPEPLPRARCRKPRPQRLKRRNDERDYPMVDADRAGLSATCWPAAAGDVPARRRVALRRAAAVPGGFQPANRPAAVPRGGLLLAAAGACRWPTRLAASRVQAGGYANAEAEAQAVYDRWLARTREGDVLTVEGVGVLKFKNFIARTRRSTGG